MIARIERWVALLLLVGAILAHALVPRYVVELRPDAFVRHDRWTGRLAIWNADHWHEPVRP